MISVGTSTADSLFWGNSAVKKVYKGSDLVFEGIKDTFVSKTWAYSGSDETNFRHYFSGARIWTDGTNWYCSAGTNGQWKYNSNSDVWEDYVWYDSSDNVVYPKSAANIVNFNNNTFHYDTVSGGNWQLNTQTNKWEVLALTAFGVVNKSFWSSPQFNYLFYDKSGTTSGYHKYSSDGISWSNQTTSGWSPSDIRSGYNGNTIWTDGINTYSTRGSSGSYKAATSSTTAKTWTSVTFTGVTVSASFNGSNIYRDDSGLVLYFAYSEQKLYKLNTGTTTWSEVSIRGSIPSDFISAGTIVKINGKLYHISSDSNNVTH